MPMLLLESDFQAFALIYSIPLRKNPNRPGRPGQFGMEALGFGEPSTIPGVPGAAESSHCCQKQDVLLCKMFISHGVRLQEGSAKPRDETGTWMGSGCRRMFL